MPGQESLRRDERCDRRQSAPAESLCFGSESTALIVGKREAEERKVSIRRLGSQDQTVVTLDDALASLKTEATPPDLR